MAEPARLAPFNPTADDAIELMCVLAANFRHDFDSPPLTFFDIGCGDGRVLCAAALAHAQSCGDPRASCGDGCTGVTRCSCSFIGVEYDASLAARAASRIAALPCTCLRHRTRVLHCDAASVDMSHATHIFCFLVPTGLLTLERSLAAALLRGCSVLCNMFSLKLVDVQPVRESGDASLLAGAEVRSCVVEYAGTRMRLRVTRMRTGAGLAVTRYDMGRLWTGAEAE